MEFTAKLIAEYLKGTIEGNPDVSVQDVSKIEEGKKGTLAFLSNPKYLKYLYETEASIVLINEDLKLEREVSITLIRVKDAYQSFALLLDLYIQNKPVKNGIEKNAHVDETAKIGSDVYLGNFAYVSANAKIGNNVKIYPNVFIGDHVSIGDNTVIYANVSIYEMCIIGNNCIIHAGTVIGSDGFGHAPQEDGSYKKIPQIGNVIIEDDVELGSNVSIDRATMGSTIIRKGVKLDNLIQIAHNVEIGTNTVIASQSGVAGSSKIGANCVLAGQVGIVGHISISDKTIIASQSGVGSSIKKEGGIYLGSPIQDIGKARRSIAVYKQLPDLRSKIFELEKELDKLKQNLKN